MVQAVREANLLASSLLFRDGKGSGQRELRPIKFLEYVRTDSGLFCFNVLTKELIKLDSPVEEEQDREFLYSHMFLVEEDCDECRISDELLETAKFYVTAQNGGGR